MRKTNEIYYSSVKSKNGANPAFLNHTSRNAKIFNPSGSLNKYLPSIDSLLQEYICKRNTKTITEDTYLNKLNCMKDSLIRSDVIDMMSHFMFDGSGKGDSNCKANSMIIYHNDSIRFIKCSSLEERRNYLESILDRCILSLRDKGMPKIITDSCRPWVFEDHKQDGSIKYKGSIHMRIK